MPSCCNAVACMRGCTSAKSATRTPPNLLTQSQTMTHTPPHTHLRARLLAASLLACATLATLLPAHTAQAQYSPAPAVSQPQTTLPRTRLQLGRKLSTDEVSQIVAFLDTLTGDQPDFKLPILPPSSAKTPRPTPFN